MTFPLVSHLRRLLMSSFSVGVQLLFRMRRIASNDTPKCLCSICSVNCSGYCSCSVRMAAIVSGESLVRGLQRSEPSLVRSSCLRIIQVSFVGVEDVDGLTLDVEGVVVLREVVESVE